MNKLEHQMIDILIDLKTNYHVTGVKAEFEAEGTRLDEAMRLKNVTSAADLGLNIKIGGCEAIKDMLDAISLGAQRIIAPMIETPYALQKFLRAAKIIYGDDLRDVELLANIETITAYRNFSEMLKIPEITLLNGIVIGRVDFTGSIGWSRNDINSEKVLKYSLELSSKAKLAGLRVVVGGGVSVDSVPFFKAFPLNHLDRFETRKVIFQCPAAIHNPEAAFIKAIQFELLWLKNKRDHYSTIAREDNERIQLMEKRYEAALSEINKKY